MAVVSSDDQRLRDRARALFGPDLTAPAALAEALRCELSAERRIDLRKPKEGKGIGETGLSGEDGA